MVERLIAALPMYDWPERRAAVDDEWKAIRAGLLARGIDAPENLARRNGDLPEVPGGIRDRNGLIIAPDPATLPPDTLDLAVLWRHPALVFGQTCRGPMEFGLAAHTSIIGEPNYDNIEGGAGKLYSSALVIRKSDVPGVGNKSAPDNGQASIPFIRLRGKRFAFNSTDSMSGYLGLKRDLEVSGEDFSIFSSTLVTGAHRASIRMVAIGKADIAAIDARSWALALAFEPAAAELVVAGWTSLRQGLPFICAKALAHLHHESA
jgi:ABC-type phosphate/phosphonate transport system substrate-binding protein